jgi:hypothetical protein
MLLNIWGKGGEWQEWQRVAPAYPEIYPKILGLYLESFSPFSAP